MFISKLNNIVEAYDKYGEHRLNGLKVVYVLLILYLINLAYTIPNPYFNYFYLPITAMGAEVLGETLPEKYLLFIYTIIGSIVAVFFFSVIRSYPFLFLFFVFSYSLFLYYIALNLTQKMFVPVPIILSLACYSLVYGQVNPNFYAALNNAAVTLVAAVAIMASLLLFPRSYYLRSWLRAFILLLQQILDNYTLIAKNQEIKIQPVQGNMVRLAKYANMLPRRLPIFTILKINLLMDDLRLLSCVTDQKIIKIDQKSLNLIMTNLHHFILAVKKEKPYHLTENDSLLFAQIVAAWNSLCSKI